MPPEGTDFVLSSDVPDGEGDVLVLDSLDIETCVMGGGGKLRVQCKICDIYFGRRCLPMVGIVVTISPSLSL